MSRLTNDAAAFIKEQCSSWLQYSRLTDEQERVSAWIVHLQVYDKHKIPHPLTPRELYPLVASQYQK